MWGSYTKDFVVIEIQLSITVKLASVNTAVDSSTRKVVTLSTHTSKEEQDGRANGGIFVGYFLFITLF